MEFASAIVYKVALHPNRFVRIALIQDSRQSCPEVKGQREGSLPNGSRQAGACGSS